MMSAYATSTLRPRGDRLRRGHFGRSQAPAAEGALRAQGDTYECGIPATGSTEVKLNIRFHTYALLFVLFDVEVLYVSRGRSRPGKLGESR